MTIGRATLRIRPSFGSIESRIQRRLLLSRDCERIVGARYAAPLCPDKPKALTCRHSKARGSASCAAVRSVRSSPASLRFRANGSHFFLMTVRLRGCDDTTLLANHQSHFLGGWETALFPGVRLVMNRRKREREYYMLGHPERLALAPRRPRLLGTMGGEQAHLTSKDAFSLFVSSLSNMMARRSAVAR